MPREPNIPPVRCVFAEDGAELEELLQSSLEAWVRGRLQDGADPLQSGCEPG